MLFAIFTRNSINGTSVNTPTVVASAAGESIPNNAIATATANSKKFEAPIIPAGAATSKGILNHLHAPYAIKNIKNVWIVKGTNRQMWQGYSMLFHLE